MLKITWRWAGSLAAAVIVATVAGCSRKAANEHTSAGAVDTGAARTELSEVTPAVGPAVQVTRTDEKSVDKAMKFELTPDNFAKFLAAADSITALEARDTATNRYLAKNITDAGSKDTDAGLKWLESNDSVSKAINSAGISVRDYFVASIAAAAAARFIGDPKAAPGTPTLTKNADFLRTRSADLARLQAMRNRVPVVTATP
jgi:hypothetical protein